MLVVPPRCNVRVVLPIIVSPPLPQPCSILPNACNQHIQGSKQTDHVESCSGASTCRSHHFEPGSEHYCFHIGHVQQDRDEMRQLNRCRTIGQLARWLSKPEVLTISEEPRNCKGVGRVCDLLHAVSNRDWAQLSRVKQ